MNRKAKTTELTQEGYSINVTGRHVLVTDAMKDYAIEKIFRIERFSDRIIEVQLTMDIQKLEHRVDIVMKVDHIKIKSSASSDDMYVSIDMAIHKLETQLLRYKDKLQDHQRKALGVVDINVNVLKPARESDLADINEDIDEENNRELIQSYSPHRIVKQESCKLKTLTFDEAVTHMELSQDAFLLFNSIQDNQLKVIYRRNDGNFGVIEPTVPSNGQ